MTLRMGDELQSAMWLTGAETPSQLDSVKASIVGDFNMAQKHHGVLVGPIAYHELKPIDDGCPDPPPWCHGPDVRILVGETKVVCRAPDVPIAKGFSTLVDAKTLAEMRAVTRRQHRMARPGERPLTDAQCDVMIDRVAPDTAERMLRDASDGGGN